MNKTGCSNEKMLEKSKAKLLKQTDDGKRANSIKSRLEKQKKKRH